jgi:hypothetical protein
MFLEQNCLLEKHIMTWRYVPEMTNKYIPDSQQSNGFLTKLQSYAVVYRDNIILFNTHLNDIQSFKTLPKSA